MVFVLDGRATTGACAEFVPLDYLTLIDTEPAHPEFLETEDDYEQAPVGTIVAATGARPWVKLNDGTWLLGGGIDERASILEMNTGSRRVLRWGTGES